ncbi:PREDICTED: uncharacterized protein LOC108782841 [Cyphomyrmex costatus]|uniref:Uncharacterized protein n=1 Tax=Cyphomyrmex costatus TaxID=456900 RepID=A0A195D1A7_9HYME|nr:PREDICTED: uncharacterized protein LOC108782841 [Cyphomyrmex costatus]KYN06631.1 hypothetical protein ALC62_02288 [Cyphomyrmex costatus]
MNLSVSMPIVCVLLVTLLSETAHARPPQLVMRPKRLSDQRLAEIETLLALEKVKGYVVPVGLGIVDPAKLGRKRRSISENNPPKLQHFVLLITRPGSESTVDQSD